MRFRFFLLGHGSEEVPRLKQTWFCFWFWFCFPASLRLRCFTWSQAGQGPCSPGPGRGLGDSPRPSALITNLPSAWPEPVISETQRGCPPAPSLGFFPPLSLRPPCGLPPGTRRALTYLVTLVDAVDELGAGGIPGEADGRGVGGFGMHVARRDCGDWGRAERCECGWRGHGLSVCLAQGSRESTRGLQTQPYTPPRARSPMETRDALLAADCLCAWSVSRV